MDRLIFHVDVNSAFLSWEATRRVSLRETSKIVAENKTTI